MYQRYMRVFYFRLGQEKHLKAGIYLLISDLSVCQQKFESVSAAKFHDAFRFGLYPMVGHVG